MLAGSETKLLLLKHRTFNERKFPISFGIDPSPRLQSLISNFVKEHKLDREGGKLKATGSELLRIKDEIRKASISDLQRKTVRIGFPSRWREKLIDHPTRAENLA